MQPKAVVILGMGKSGTSLLSNIIHNNKSIKKEIVFNPIKFLKEKNKIKTTYYEFYENIELKTINKEMLIDQKKNQNHNVLNLNQNFNDLIKKNNYKSNIKFLILKKNKLIFKDPRTLINFKFWDKNILFKNYISIFRNPYDVCGRYLRPYQKNEIKLKNYKIKNLLKYVKSKIYFEYKKFLLTFKVLRSWYLFNNKILYLLNEQKINFLVRYEDLNLLKPYTNVKINSLNKTDKNIYLNLGKLYCKIIVGDIDILNKKLIQLSKKNKITKILNF